MKIFIVKFIIVFQFAFCGLVYAELEEVVSGENNLEQNKPALPDDPFLQAEYLFHSGDFIGAKPLFHDYLSHNPSGKRSYLALFRLGWIDQSNLSFSTAVRFYQIFLEKFPGSLLANSARFNMAVCHYELADYDRAEALFQMVLRSSLDKKRKWEIMVQ